MRRLAYTSLLLLAACQTPGTADTGEMGESTSSGDGDGTPGDGDGTPGDGDGTPGDGDGDGTPGDTCQDGLVPDMTFVMGYDSVAHGWVRAEHWQIEGVQFPDDPFFPDARSEQSGQQLEFFGFDPTPGPEHIVLQFGPGWDTHSGNPVLFVHGADDPPDRAWANPGVKGPYGCGDMVCPDTGLMQTLAAANIPTFAIAFPNKQGNNYHWAEQIHAAISVIRELTCADKVDVIAWSKGTMGARMYASSLTEAWGTPYTDDIRKLILMGGPNLGMDYVFRHGSNNNTTAWPPGMANGPTAHHEQLVGLQVIDRSEFAIYETAAGYYYRGQAQMLARWDNVFELALTANNGLGDYAIVDLLSTYYGEGMYFGTLARGRGIDHAIAQSSVIDEMIAAGIDPGVQTYLLCAELHDPVDFMVGTPNEIAGPSDGIVFVQSCAAPDGIGQLGGIEILQDINHLELGWAPEAKATIVGWLGQ